MIAFAGAPPSDDEIVAIVAALTAIEPAEQNAPSTISRWKMAGREYAAWDDRCLAKF